MKEAVVWTASPNQGNPYGTEFFCFCFFRQGPPLEDHPPGPRANQGPTRAERGQKLRTSNNPFLRCSLVWRWSKDAGNHLFFPGVDLCLPKYDFFGHFSGVYFIEFAGTARVFFILSRTALIQTARWYPQICGWNPEPPTDFRTGLQLRRLIAMIFLGIAFLEPASPRSLVQFAKPSSPRSVLQQTSRQRIDLRGAFLCSGPVPLQLGHVHLPAAVLLPGLLRGHATAECNNCRRVPQDACTWSGTFLGSDPGVGWVGTPQGPASVFFNGFLWFF